MKGGGFMHVFLHVHAMTGGTHAHQASFHEPLVHALDLFSTSRAGNIIELVPRVYMTGAERMVMQSEEQTLSRLSGIQNSYIVMGFRTVTFTTFQRFKNGAKM
jgi:hypothetical protein